VRIANELKPYRCIHNTIGEADEARPARVPEKMYEILREVRKIVRPAPVGYHSINDNSRDADHLDFISAQEHRGHIDWNGFLRLKDKFEMPVLVLEDQDSTEDQIIHNLKESLRLGIVYTVTGKNLHTTPQFEQRIKDVFAGIA